MRRLQWQVLWHPESLAHRLNRATLKPANQIQGVRHGKCRRVEGGERERGLILLGLHERIRCLEWQDPPESKQQGMNISSESMWGARAGGQRERVGVDGWSQPFHRVILLKKDNGEHSSGEV